MSRAKTGEEAQPTGSHVLHPFPSSGELVNKRNTLFSTEESLFIYQATVFCQRAVYPLPVGSALLLAGGLSSPRTCVLGLERPHQSYFTTDLRLRGGAAGPGDALKLGTIVQGRDSVNTPLTHARQRVHTRINTEV